MGPVNNLFAKPSTPDDGVGKPKSLIEWAYRQLGDDIVHGKFAPGSKVKLEPLGNLYGVSIGTIREALSLLVSDGLVIANSQRGFCVAPMSLEGFRDLVNTRLLLEVSALHMSILNGDDVWEGRVVQAFHQLSLAEHRLGDSGNTFELWELRNREYHEALVSACDSEWTLRFREILYRQSERYRRMTYTSHTSPGPFVHMEHKKLFDLAMSRKADQAIDALIEHIRSPLSVAEMSKMLSMTSSEDGSEKRLIDQSRFVRKLAKS